MRRIITLSVFVSAAISGFAQSGKLPLKEGAALYREGKFAEAEEKFKQGATTSPQNQTIADFNAADAAYKQEKFTEAQSQFLNIAKSASSDKIKAKAYHNLGNTFLKSKDLENSIKAYQNSLILNPEDEDTRYNLSYAVQQLKQQQQQQEQQEQNKDDKKEEEKEDEKKDQEQKQDQQKQDENQDKKEQEKNQKQEQQEQQQKEQQNQMSRKNAENILDALQEKEKGIQKKVKEKNKGNAKKTAIEKDW